MRLKANFSLPFSSEWLLNGKMRNSLGVSPFAELESELGANKRLVSMPINRLKLSQVQRAAPGLNYLAALLSSLKVSICSFIIINNVRGEKKLLSHWQCS